MFLLSNNGRNCWKFPDNNCSGCTARWLSEALSSNNLRGGYNYGQASVGDQFWVLRFQLSVCFELRNSFSSALPFLLPSPHKRLATRTAEYPATTVKPNPIWKTKTLLLFNDVHTLKFSRNSLPKCAGTLSFLFSPTHMSLSPWSQPWITMPLPRVKSNVWPRLWLESKTEPSFSSRPV